MPKHLVYEHSNGLTKSCTGWHKSCHHLSSLLVDSLHYPLMTGAGICESICSNSFEIIGVYYTYRPGILPELIAFSAQEHLWIYKLGP